jgi:molybdopterin molybdotransferase
MIPVSDALQFIDREIELLPSEAVHLADARGRVLYEDVIADHDLPPFDRSQMDGYALRAADTMNSPVELKIVGESAAGRGWNGVVGHGEAVRIMTGARLPDGSDSVQKIELCDESDDGTEVTVREAVDPGRYIVARATEVKKGSIVLTLGTEVTPNVLAVAAAFGRMEINVARRPRVAIVATGTEIVPVSDTPGPDQIRNSNSVMLFANATADGALCQMLPNTGDDLEDIAAAISAAIKECDILITTGGVSVGKYDLTETALKQLGGRIFFDRLRLKPGKPAVFAKVGNAAVFSLPGNPVSAAVTYYLFVRRAIRRMQGAAHVGLKSITATAGSDIKGTKERDVYLPVTISSEGTSAVADPMKWHGSSDLVGFSSAEGLAFIEAGSRAEKGSLVKVFLF